MFADAHIRGGWCNPVLEAMACGVPVVCTDTNCNSDFAVDGYNCYKVSESDVEAMKSCIYNILYDNSGLYKMLIKNGIETAARYDYNIIGANFEREILKRIQ